MQRIDLSYLYEYSNFFNFIYDIDETWSLDRQKEHLKSIETQIKTIISHSVYSSYLYSCIKPAQTFLNICEKFYEKNTQWSFKEIDFLRYAAREFEAVLKSALSASPSYLVTPKGGFDLNILTLNPHSLFPSSLIDIVPETQYDVEQAAKCLSFDIPTGAAFHLHRINESVLRKYWCVISKEEFPENSNVGAILKAIEAKRNDDIWNPLIISTLKQINNLHRNPTIHPELQLTSEESIILFGIINSAISSMLMVVNEKQRKYL